MKHKFYWALLSCSIGLTHPATSQVVIADVITDFNGSIWSSSTTSNNPTHPNDSHNLLAFSYNGTTYSTGVNDAMLTANTITFVPLSVASFTIPNNALNAPVGGSTYIGVGFNYGGGAGNVAPIPVVNNMAQYLTDGAVQGLDLGTGVFNIPHSEIVYAVSGFNIGSVGDGIPDILLTQIGSPPSTANDTILFTDINGNMVGNFVVGNVASIATVAQTDWKFYTPTDPPVYTLIGGQTRDLRMVGFDLQDFGLTTLDLPSITNFKHRVSGESDQAFLAHNTASFTSDTGIVTPLPINLESFTADKTNHAVRLSWKASGAKAFSHFELEHRAENEAQFKQLAVIPFHENKFVYTETHHEPAHGRNYYRLKLVDEDGSFNYSKVVLANFSATADIKILPNPAHETINIYTSVQTDQIIVSGIEGKTINLPVKTGSGYQSIDVSTLPSGIYFVRIISGTDVAVEKIRVQH